MHFPIIRISTEKISPEDWDINLPYDDSTLNYWTDYTGDVYTKEGRDYVLNSEWFKAFWEGLGDYDAKKGEVKLYTAERIKNTILIWLKDEAQTILKGFDDPSTTPFWRHSFAMRMASYEYKNLSTIFVIDGYAQKSMDFVEDLIYHAGKTLYIENIFDAHV